MSKQQKFPQKNDILKRPISVGDTVFFHRPKSSGIGIVVKWSEVMIQVERQIGIKKKINVHPDELVVINEQLKFNKEKYPEYFI